MWARQSHLLHPLTKFVSNKTKFEWTDVEQKTFDDIKCAVTHYTLLLYPDINKRFDINKDVSNYQLGSVIRQGEKPIYFYSHKLAGLQMRYTATKNE